MRRWICRTRFLAVTKLVKSTLPSRRQYLRDDLKAGDYSFPYVTRWAEGSTDLVRRLLSVPSDAPRPFSRRAMLREPRRKIVGPYR